MRDLAGRTAVVTGAASGIGLALRAGRFWVFTEDAAEEHLRKSFDDILEGREPARPAGQ